MDTHELLLHTSDPAFYARLAPRLGISSGGRTENGAASATATEGVARQLQRNGFAELVGIASNDASPLGDAVEALVASGVHPAFVYVWDETWKIGRRIAHVVGREVGAEYHLLADAWAFCVPAGPQHAGWSPHRGSYDRLDRSAPELVNVWLALTDARPESSCMHVVALDDDPDYPGALPRHDAASSGGRALPVSAGTALLWNANVLHWGGPSSDRALRPRLSVTYTLERTDHRGDTARVDFSRFALSARLELVAQQVLTYGHLDASVTAALRGWASLILGFRAAAATRKER